MSKANKSLQNKAERLIPTLRFPEFKNEGEWVEKKLGEIAELTSSKRVHLADYVSSGVPFFRGKEISQLKNNQTLEDILYIPNEQYIEIKEKYGVPEKGDILITSVGTLGNVYCIKDNSPFYFKDGNLIWMKNIKIASFFLEVLLDVEKEKILASAIGSSQKALTMAALNKLEFQIPKNPNEQQKIASCLSSLDEVISTHNQKLELLKDHKKGLMQNLFPSPEPVEGRNINIPAYRFPEFEKDGDWVEKSLDEMATFLKGKGISKSDIATNGKLPCIRYGELYTHYNETIDKIKSYTNLDSDELVLSEANDVIIPASGETQIDIAKASCVLKRGIALGGDLNIIRSKIDGVFLSYYLNNVKKKEIAQMAQGISVVHLYPTQLKTLNIQIPNPKEQQKIASCLSSLDALITAEAEKIEHLKLHKKGLMQGLFPKMNG